MARLEEVGTYKNKILELLITDDNIVKAVGNNETNFLDVVSISNPKDLLFNNIFPYCFVPENTDEQKTYISVAFKFSGGREYFKLGRIGFLAFTHNGLLKTDYPEMRTDYIIQRIDTLFHENIHLSIGELQFSKYDDMKISKYHSGVYLEYKNLVFD